MRNARGDDSMDAARLSRARYTPDGSTFTQRFWRIVGRQMLIVADREEG